ncbi:hypothetical protein [Mesorhizobium sp.]|uniref:hypothetical protein n=1 Tax=Mesorhizobium sp. TaxID=1871066 RepID=UPI001203A381|nr:hypothetical protein [Mesorhizobium sp.]TIP18429.1 MAG: hypothetical protein E5X66_15720 [Mesorhizobium sp.]
MTDGRQPYEVEFDELMEDVDPLVPVVLKGHLLIERILDDVISSVCCNPDHIWNGRFTFAQKVNLARAFAFNRDKHPVWTIVLALNTLRNEIAHNRLGERTRSKMDQVRRLWLAEVDEVVRELDEEDADPVVVIHATGLCGSFLAEIKEGLGSVRPALEKSLTP